MSNHLTILKDIEDVEKKVVRLVKAVATDALNRVVDFSPTPGGPGTKGDGTNYSIGSYLLSHNVSVGAPDESSVLLTSADKSAATKAKAKAKSLKLGDITIGRSVFINNGIEYADTVELVGWPAGQEGDNGKYKGTAPYRPYSKAFAATSIYAEAEAKAL